MSRKQPDRHPSHPAPTQDTPEALAVGGFDDEEAETQREPALAEKVGPTRAIRLFYRHYWNDRGTASASEFGYALAYFLTLSLLYGSCTLLLGRAVTDENASSLLRTLSMLCTITYPLWLAVNLVPLLSLFKRRRTARRARRAGH